ncbi:MAG TPA: sigma-E factor negative regulatory protein [Burkholderiales bacterium]|jgi:sigma-E factor negative regulatory protein RseA
MDKISELMDGELPRRESKRQIVRLERDPQLSERWDTYHLIRDTLRREVDLGPSFTHRVRTCLEQEPLVIAPHARIGYRMARYTLPMAAAAAGVAVVAWLTLAGEAPPGAPPTMAERSAPLALSAPSSVPSAPSAMVRASANGATSDYLVAHQEFSPRTAMQGVASYARTVTAGETNPGR